MDKTVKNAISQLTSAANTLDRLSLFDAAERVRNGIDLLEQFATRLDELEPAEYAPCWSNVWPSGLNHPVCGQWMTTKAEALASSTWTEDSPPTHVLIRKNGKVTIEEVESE